MLTRGEGCVWRQERAAAQALEHAETLASPPRLHVRAPHRSLNDYDLLHAVREEERADEGVAGPVSGRTALMQAQLCCACVRSHARV